MYHSPYPDMTHQVLGLGIQEALFLTAASLLEREACPVTAVCSMPRG